MRGTPACATASVRTSGIIPAYAGNTVEPMRSTTPRRDHPRVCGEHTVHNPTGKAAEGSSPRMRGTQMKLNFDSKDGGIIPAYAGNTKCRENRPRIRRDHPRVCGEHDSTVSDRDLGRGSSPRMRGTHHTEPLHLHRSGSSPRMRGTRLSSFCLCYSVGIIPAYAGNTQDCR